MHRSRRKITGDKLYAIPLGSPSLGQHRKVNAIRAANLVLQHQVYLFRYLPQSMRCLFLSFPFVPVNCINMKIDYVFNVCTLKANVWDPRICTRHNPDGNSETRVQKERERGGNNMLAITKEIRYRTHT